MPLVLSLKAGESFYVGDQKLLVTEVFSETSFRVLHCGTGQVFDITADEKTEVLQDVFIFGARRRKPPKVNLTIAAPRNRHIRRGKR